MDPFNKVLLIGMVDSTPLRLVSPEGGRVTYYLNLKTMKGKYNLGTWVKVYCAMEGEAELEVQERDLVLLNGRLIRRKTKVMDSEGKPIYQFAINCHQNSLWNLDKMVAEKEHIWSNEVSPRPSPEEVNDVLSELEREFS